MGARQPPDEAPCEEVVLPLTVAGRRTEPAEEDARIDYCWVRGQYAKTVAVRDVKIVANQAPYLSDHYGVLAELDVTVDPAFSEE